MRALDVRGLSVLRLSLALTVSGALCAMTMMGCASGIMMEPEDAGPRMDANRDAAMFDAGRVDAPMTDARTDTGSADVGPSDVGNDAAGTACGSVVCTGFTYCMGGACIDYPACRGDGTCPTAGDICIARRCVPGTVDVDGDGSPASADCDETDPTRSPLATERCNNRDDDCDGLTDDGDTTALCEADPAGGICAAGVCGCPAGTFDVDRTVPGCECTASPGTTSGATCAAPIDLGNLSDTGTGAVVTQMGNALPQGREVWYRFRAVDSPDASCDNFRVRVHFVTNPGMAYDFYVRQGTCGAEVQCGGFGESFQDYVLATDFRADTGGGVLGGECPCTTAGALVANVSLCTDNSADYFVRVRRLPSAPLACSAYTIEFSNGI